MFLFTKQDMHSMYGKLTFVCNAIRMLQVFVLIILTFDCLNASGSFDYISLKSHSIHRLQVSHLASRELEFDYLDLIANSFLIYYSNNVIK